MKKITSSLSVLFYTLRLFAQQDETEMKANFIFSFADYVEWTDTPAKSKLVIGLIGNNPILIPLVKIAQKKVSEGKAVEVHLWLKPEEISSCNILFIDDSMEKRMPDIFKKTQGKHVLTVSDTKDFIEKGGIIRFVRKKEKVKFEISRSAMERNNLKIGSQLLKLAKLVD